MNEKNKKRIFYGILVVLFLLLLLLLLVRCHPTETNVTVLPQNGALVSDTVSQEELQQMMDDSMIAISINATPVFKDASSQGNLQIENLAINKRLFRIEIYLNSDVEQGDFSSPIYQTDSYLAPDSHIQNDTLDAKLPAGSYPCTAFFRSYALDQPHEYMGSASAGITITVEQ